jgi:hypothetical protein
MPEDINEIVTRELLMQIDEEIAEVEDHSDQSDDMMRRFIQRRGWSQTSAWPDAVWRWKKTFPKCGQITTSSESEAFRLEVHLNVTAMLAHDLEPRKHS